MRGIVKSPKELFYYKQIPKFVYEEFERMILERYDGSVAIFSKQDIKEAINARRHPLDSFKEEWLDIDEDFTVNGWKVSRLKRGRVGSDNYDTFMFKSKEEEKDQFDEQESEPKKRKSSDNE
jgi:hypothetical protein